MKLESALPAIAFLVVLSGAPVQGGDSLDIRVVRVLRSPKDAGNQPAHFRPGSGDLESQVELLKGRIIESQTNRIALEGKLDELQARYTGLEGNLKQAQADKTELETKSKQAAADREQFEAKLKEAQADRIRLETKLKEAAADRLELESKLGQAAAERKRIEAELAQGQADRSGIEAQLKEVQAARETEAEKLRALQQLKNQLGVPAPPSPTNRSSPHALFRGGADAYRAGDYARAATTFRQSATSQPASGTLQNLGNAEWKLGHPGAAILAWEQALWVDPFNEPARADLRFARKTAQLESPELAWYEVVSAWLPANWWAWTAGVSLWLAVGMVMLPGIFRLRKAAWQQALAALALMMFLLSIPANIGVHTRSRIGFVLQKDTPLRLTPTLEAQAVTRLAAGDPARFVRARGNYALVRTNRALGWVERNQFGLISGGTRLPSPNPASPLARSNQESDKEIPSLAVSP